MFLASAELQRLAEQLRQVDPKVWGPATWAHLRQIVYDIPCKSCREHGLKVLSAWQDLVNLHKGEELYDRANFIEIGNQFADSLKSVGYDERHANRLNIQNPIINSKMATTREAGLIIGGSFVGKGIEKAGPWIDQALGMSAQPITMRPSTWIPPVGGAVLIAAAMVVSAIKRREGVQLAMIAAGANLLTKTVDIVETLTTGGAGLSLVRSNGTMPQFAPSLTMATQIPIY